MTDLTGLKVAEAKLKESEIRYRAVFENTGAATIIFDKEGVISSVASKYESKLIAKDGRIKNTLITVDKVPGSEEWVSSILDITELRNTEKDLKKSLEEKEMLLKEIHHRVKNNLMVISSLLNLQSQYINDKEVLDIFRESQNRAKSMALIHQRLYESSDLKRIDFGSTPDRSISIPAGLRPVDSSGL